MTTEEFIKLARKAGFVHGNPHSEIIVRHSSGAWVSIEERLHQFAILVAAAEREACAKIADSEISKYPPGTPFNQYQSGIFTAAEHIDDAIRARGDHGKS